MLYFISLLTLEYRLTLQTANKTAQNIAACHNCGAPKCSVISLSPVEFIECNIAVSSRYPEQIDCVAYCRACARHCD